ncbi:MAG: RecX family transcriptional regulator [candidate division Zixibacteria bacterium]|nr:RecX family transcriptional regulator [candidate division Zixibacteria bacterium]
MADTVRITGMKERGGVFQISLSDRSDPIPVDPLIVARHRLKEGIVLTSPQVADLVREAELSACDREVARLLALRPHAIGEVRLKLQRKQFASDVVTGIVRKYEQKGLLDDGHVAMMLARATLERHPAGRSYLVAVLRRKMIDRELAEQTVDLVLGDRDETEIAYAALMQRRRLFVSSTEIEVESVRRKAYTFLSRRGIGYAPAKAAFERLLKEQEKTDPQ